MSTQALIFDFDGLILDTEYPEYLSWKAIFHRYSLPLDIKQWKPGLPKGSRSLDLLPYQLLEQALGKAIDRAAICAEREGIYAGLLDHQQVLPGVKTLLADAAERGIAMAIASSSPRHWVTHWLTRLGLAHYFSAVCCGDDVRYPKPDPELYRLALARLAVSAECAIAFEDSEVGVAAARSAGLRVAAIPNPLTIHSDLSGASVILGSMAEANLDTLGQLPEHGRQR